MILNKLKKNQKSLNDTFNYIAMVFCNVSPN